jgi:tetratricopeptide (TPR) repeat protein
MRRLFGIGICLIVLFSLPLSLLAEDTMAQGSALMDKGKANYESYKQAGDSFVKALEANPNSYEAAWKAAEAFREYCENAKKQNVPDWKGICKEYGKIGMKNGEKAIALNPGAIEGNFWYGCCVGSYSDGVSVLTALKEGLKGKTQSSFEKSYELNKMYHDGGPIKALGRFWFVLPWPLQDKKLSLKYFREFQKLYPNDPEGQVFLGELLMNMKEKDEAKSLLQNAAASSDKYFSSEAKRLLAEM